MVCGCVFVCVSGANTVLAPLYISEVSPIQHRGTMGVCHQLMISIMILISQLLGMEKVIKSFS